MTTLLMGSFLVRRFSNNFKVCFKCPFYKTVISLTLLVSNQVYSFKRKSHKIFQGNYSTNTFIKQMCAVIPPNV